MEIRASPPPQVTECATGRRCVAKTRLKTDTAAAELWHEAMALKILQKSSVFPEPGRVERALFEVFPSSPKRDRLGLPVRTADQARDGARGVNVGIECLGMCESPSVPFSGDPVEKDAGELESLRTEGCKSGCSKEVGAELKFLC